MTDLPATRFLLELKLDARPPRAVLSDITTSRLTLDAPTSSADVELGTTAPYQLGMAFVADTPAGALRPKLDTLVAIPHAPPRPFDPALAGDDGVLSLEWRLRDRSVETQDESVLQIALSNRSNYYEADDLEIGLELIACDGSFPRDRERPDGSALVSIIPAVQRTRCIGPHATSLFDFVLVTRGPQAGLYNLAVEVNYKLVYVYRELCRHTLAIASLPLRIHGGSAPPLSGPLVSPSYELQAEQITVPQRKLHMPDLIENDTEHTHSRRRELHAIERRIMLPGGGEICVAYRLVKGSHTKPDDSRCSFGYNPRTKEVESYFSTSDEAAMEITLQNHSGLHLKHIYLTDVHLFTMGDEGGAGHPADKDTLPDGNHLFEVLPNEVYFGHLLPGEKTTRYLGLVTRGVHAGRFVVRFDVKYEIVDGNACVTLPLTVNPD